MERPPRDLVKQKNSLQSSDYRITHLLFALCIHITYIYAFKNQEIHVVDTCNLYRITSGLHLLLCLLRYLNYSQQAFNFLTISSKKNLAICTLRIRVSNLQEGYYFLFPSLKLQSNFFSLRLQLFIPSCQTILN